MPPRAAASRTVERLRARKRHQGSLAALLAVSAAFVIAPASALGQFQLGIEDPLLNQPTPTALSTAAFGTFRQLAASTTRVAVAWETVAPTGAAMPAGFNPSNPADPHYRWGSIDAAVRSAADHGASPLFEIFTAPGWAQPPGKPADVSYFRGAWDPSATQFRSFSLALARRYSGNFPDPLQPGTDLPRVKLYEIWNEENIRYELAAPDPVGEYRSLLNAAYGAIKSIHEDNVVAIGGLGNVGVARFSTPYGIRRYSISPLKFAAALMCLRRVGTHFVRSPTCPVRAHFDVLAVHPYTLASTPTKHAYHYDDVLVGDMGKVRTLLQAAETLHTAAPNIEYGLWVTEWSWFSNPPNPVIGEPDAVAARYTAYGMYELWRSGVSLVIWLLIRYEPAYLNAPPAGKYGGALFTVSGEPTLKLRAFEFPVVAAVKGGRGFVWGRAPVKHKTQVFVQHAIGSRWRTIGRVRTTADGVFEFHFTARGNGRYRAQIKHGLVSLGYDSTPIPPKRDRAFKGGG